MNINFCNLNGSKIIEPFNGEITWASVIKDIQSIVLNNKEYTLAKTEFVYVKEGVSQINIYVEPK
ncbi:hypothetical protein ABN764_07650 [Paenibacillaceae sp. P-4]|uniref:hypothetical protein n=1 Tax=Paenibacillaceae bacterium P-4 TaxID=3160969 RepID=UPI0032E84D38